MRINKVLEKIKTSDDTEDIVIASMNLDDEAKKLSIIEELNHKDENQLKEEYGVSKEKAEELASKLLAVTTYYLMFPYAIFNNFPKFCAVMNYLDGKYELSDDAKSLPVFLNSKVSQLLKNSKLYEHNSEDGEYMLDCKAERMGILGYFHTNKFENLNRVLCNGTTKINEAMKVNPVLPSKEAYDEVLDKTFSLNMDGFIEESEQELENYRKKYPLLNLMHDTEVLCTLNYIISADDGPNEAAAEVLAVSLIDYSEYYSSDNKTDSSLYDQISRTTIRYIKDKQKGKNGRARFLARK